MNRLLILPLVAITAVALAGCGSSTNSSTSTQTTTAPTDYTAPAAATFPVGAAVTAGPLGGKFCDQAAAYWKGSGGAITVSVIAQGPADISVQVVDSANNPIGNGVAKIDQAGSGAQIPVSVSTAKVGGVSMAIAGAVTGQCVVQKLP
jgi:hypothetical protein